MCTVAFLIEIIIKLYGTGALFFEDHTNLFDLMLVLASSADFIGLEGEGGLAALRTLRLLRLFRMGKMQVNISVLLSVLRRATIPTYSFFMVVALVLYCFALLGLNLLYKVKRTDESPLDFQSIDRAFITAFTALYSEGWFENALMLARAGTYPAAMIIMFIAMLIMGHVILMSLFLGIFVAAFAQTRD
jgi:hypothetical protein